MCGKIMHNRSAQARRIYLGATESGLPIAFHLFKFTQLFLDLRVNRLLLLVTILHLYSGAVHVTRAHRAIIFLIQVAQLIIELDFLQGQARVLFAVTQLRRWRVRRALRRGMAIEWVEYIEQGDEAQKDCDGHLNGLHDIYLSSLRVS